MTWRDQKEKNLHSPALPADKISVTVFDTMLGENGKTNWEISVGFFHFRSLFGQ